MRKTHTLSVVMKGLTDIPDTLFMDAQEEGVNVIDLSKNKLTGVPEGYCLCIIYKHFKFSILLFHRLSHMEALATEINLSHNSLTTFPPFISQFSRITFLNLSNNHFTDLPKQIGLLNTLRELNIANNR